MNHSSLIFGCGNFGGIGSNPKFYAYGDDEKTARGLLDRAYAMNIRQFDTANAYGGGASERTLGSWLKKQSVSKRQNIRIQSKVGNPYGLINPNRSPLSYEEIIENIDRSLERLGVEQIDTYYMHEMDRAVDPAVILEAFAQALHAGKIGAIGLSNVSLNDVNTFLNVAGSSLAPRINVVQNEFNYLVQDDADELIPALQKKGISYTAFSPLAGGMLTRPYTSPDGVPKDSRLDRFAQHYQRFFAPTALARVASLAESAASAKQTMAETALQFIIDAPGISHVIIAPRTERQFREMGLH